MRGYLQERRIRYKAKKFGIEVSQVNPAHSSRECPRCHCTDKKNRLGDSFKCSFCGYHGHADLVAALNILGRLGDKDIRIGMSPSRVKAVLDGRYVGWKSLNHTVSDRTSGAARVVNESPLVQPHRSSQSRSNVQSLYSFPNDGDEDFRTSCCFKTILAILSRRASSMRSSLLMESSFADFSMKSSK